MSTKLTQSTTNLTVRNGFLSILEVKQKIQSEADLASNRLDLLVNGVDHVTEELQTFQLVDSYGTPYEVVTDPDGSKCYIYSVSANGDAIDLLYTLDLPLMEVPDPVEYLNDQGEKVSASVDAILMGLNQNVAGYQAYLQMCEVYLEKGTASAEQLTGFLSEESGLIAEDIKSIRFQLERNATVNGIDRTRFLTTMSEIFKPDNANIVDGRLQPPELGTFGVKSVFQICFDALLSLVTGIFTVVGGVAAVVITALSSVLSFVFSSSTKDDFEGLHNTLLTDGSVLQGAILAGSYDGQMYEGGAGAIITSGMFTTMFLPASREEAINPPESGVTSSVYAVYPNLFVSPNALIANIRTVGDAIDDHNVNDWPYFRYTALPDGAGSNTNTELTPRPVATLTDADLSLCRADSKYAEACAWASILYHWFWVGSKRIANFIYARDVHMGVDTFRPVSVRHIFNEVLPYLKGVNIDDPKTYGSFKGKAVTKDGVCFLAGWAGWAMAVQFAGLCKTMDPYSAIRHLVKSDLGLSLTMLGNLVGAFACPPKSGISAHRRCFGEYTDYYTVYASERSFNGIPPTGHDKAWIRFDLADTEVPGSPYLTTARLFTGINEIVGFNGQYTYRTLDPNPSLSVVVTNSIAFPDVSFTYSNVSFYGSLEVLRVLGAATLAVVAAVKVAKPIIKRAVRFKQAARLDATNKARQAWLAKPDDKELKKAYVKSVKSYNRLNLITGGGAYNITTGAVAPVSAVTAAAGGGSLSLGDDFEKVLIASGAIPPDADETYAAVSNVSSSVGDVVAAVDSLDSVSIDIKAIKDVTESIKTVINAVP